MWVYYGTEEKPETNGGFHDSGFNITVLDKNNTDITDRITNSAQVSGGVGGAALQFFVKTFLSEDDDGMDDDGVDGEEITVRVTGLRSLEETFKAPPATSQTQPLENPNSGN